MARSQQSRLSSICYLLLISLFTLFLFTPEAQAQTLTVLHTFTGGADGYEPYAGVTLDQQGRIYGTTIQGGLHDDGVVFRLAREGQGWALSPIYSFGSQKDDGVNPVSRVVFGPGGLLYGTTSSGGSGRGGTVFSLKPPATACKAALCPWVETILYNFTGGADGGDPLYGDLSFDQAGNIYGTTAGGGSSGEGVVFKLARSGSGWTESVLWNFTGGSDGGLPVSGVIFDSAGNLYGTTGNFPPGTVYELSPTQSGWSETTLYSFTSHTGAGSGGLIMDAHGNLFGITGGLDGGNGAAYELMPQNGSWSFTLLQNFGNEYLGTLAAPTFDSHGSLYGPVPTIGGEFTGEIFQLTPSGDQWIYRSFYTFNGSTSGVPLGAVTFDASGNMYGTGIAGGSDDDGTVWEITP
ncbi:MAG: choice-of-anchor tandem repeat GloVer-containing protein [Candidatus Korobacteraceae bacterium]